MKIEVGSKQSSRNNEEGGWILIGVLILTAMASIIVSQALSTASTNSRALYEAESRSNEYFKSEETLGKTTSWIRNNSVSLVSPFSRSNFYTTFDRTTPSNGSNDTSLFKVPTKIKMNGTNLSVMLANSNTFGTSSFPTTTDPVTGASFNPVTQFQASTYGSDLVRVTMVDAVAVDSTKDYGDTDLGNAAPQTDFYPIYRLDSMKQTDRGAHVFGYLVGSLVSNAGYGFYGQNAVTLSQPCDSYISNNGAYTANSKRANCPVGSNSTISIHQNTKIYGSAKTNGSFNTSNPYGGKVCADFTNNCPTAGSTCSGGSCGVPGIPVYQSMSTYCPSAQTIPQITSNTTLTVAGNNANQKCWNTVSIGTNTTVTLSSTQYAYYFDTLTFQNNSNSVLNIAPNPASGTVNLYVRVITGNQINGNQAFNTGNKPYQFRIHYLGTNALTINGNSQIKAFVTAPNAGVTFSGSNEFYGGIKALSLSGTGSAGLHYDESGDIPLLSDTQYIMRNLEERYR